MDFRKKYLTYHIFFLFFGQYPYYKETLTPEFGRDCWPLSAGNIKSNEIYASEIAELASSHYRRSLLVQGGLEIGCKITIKTHSSFNKTVFERNNDIVKELYSKPMDKNSY